MFSERVAEFEVVGLAVDVGGNEGGFCIIPSAKSQ
jgi:hypothetical protein